MKNCRNYVCACPLYENTFLRSELCVWFWCVFVSFRGLITATPHHLHVALRSINCVVSIPVDTSSTHEWWEIPLVRHLLYVHYVGRNLKSLLCVETNVGVDRFSSRCVRQPRYRRHHALPKLVGLLLLSEKDIILIILNPLKIEVWVWVWVLCYDRRSVGQSVME
jgi:hypothetical protein